MAFLKTYYSHFWWDAQQCCYDPRWLKSMFTFLDL
jgi:hypothetical protein